VLILAAVWGRPGERRLLARKRPTVALAEGLLTEAVLKHACVVPNRRPWHIADDVLIGSKVRYLSNFSAAPHFGERPESGRVSDAGPARAIDPYKGRRRKASDERTRGKAVSAWRLWGFGVGAAVAVDGFAKIVES